MKNKKFIWLLGTLALGLGLVLAGCSDDYEEPPYEPPTYTITFNLGGVEGTPPESISGVKSGDTITLPDVTAPEGKVFKGWGTSSYSIDVYQAGESYTVSYHYTLYANWANTGTITFDLGEISGTPPESMTVVYGTAITLPAVEAPEGKAFHGWGISSYSSTVYQAGASVTVSSNTTFTAQWANRKYAQEGIYISLISFSGDATILKVNSYSNEFVFLDNTGKNSLYTILTNSYRKATAPGTALFYGVHKGLANLTANAGEFLTDISSVNLITFTDGLDNGSFGASERNPIESKSGVASAAYASYVRDEIGSRKINSVPITAYSVGVKGSDVGDEIQFAINLGSIASTPANVKLITDFSELEGVFTGIADTITVASHFSMTTTQNDPGTIVRMTFDVTGTTPADAVLSSKYIEGALGYADSVWTLANVAYRGGITSDTPEGATIIGTVSGSNVRFVFRNISGYDPADATIQQWTKASAGSATWQKNSEYDASGSTSTSPVLIQLVLDASTSLSDTQIGDIRTAVNKFINTLYSRVYGGSN